MQGRTVTWKNPSGLKYELIYIYINHPHGNKRSRKLTKGLKRLGAGLSPSRELSTERLLVLEKA